jgi:hypothetical protein
MSEKLIADLLREVADGQVRVAQVKTIYAGFDTVVEVGLEAMDHDDVLSVFIRLPAEVADKYGIEYQVGDGHRVRPTI